MQVLSLLRSHPSASLTLKTRRQTKQRQNPRMRSWSHSHTRLTYLDARHRHVQLSFSFSPVSFSLSPASPGYGAANCAREGKGGLEEREQVVGKKKPFALKQETLWSLSSSETNRRHLFLCQQTCYHGESTQGCIALHVQAQIRLLVRLYVRCNTPLQDGVVQEQCSWEPRYTNCHQCSRTLYHTCNCYNSTSSMHVDGTGRGCMSSSEKKKNALPSNKTMYCRHSEWATGG